MSNVKKLVLSGSGVRFPVFVGALKRLTEEGYTFSEVTGTSGGSIIGAGLAMGLSIDDIENLCMDIVPRLGKLLDPSLWTMIWNWGLIKGDKIEKELLKYTQGKCMKDTAIPFKAIAVNYDKSNTLHPYHVFGTTESPDICIAKIVRASMSLPLIFEPVKINGDRYIDGGLGANFPLDIYGEDEPNVIGLYMGGFGERVSNKERGIKGLVKYIIDMIGIFMDATTQEHIEDAKLAKVIALSTTVSSMDFFIGKEEVETMIKEGYLSTDKWLLENRI